MAFLTKADLNTVADLAIIGKITNTPNPTDTDAICNTVITESIAVMKSYLARRYDTDVIFNATSTDRHNTVLKHLKGLVIYELYGRFSMDITTMAQNRYNEAMKWLEELNIGKQFDSTLPTLSTDVDEDKSINMRLGSNTAHFNSLR